MSDDQSIDRGNFTWASLRPKLARLLDSPSPHIRANLAALAAAMPEDPDAIDELASIGAAAADSIITQRGDLGDVLSAVLGEREHLGERERKRFDGFLEHHLQRESSNWPTVGVAALLRAGMPVQLLPLNYLLDSIFEFSTRVPVDPQQPQQIAELQVQRSRMNEVIKAAEAPEADEWRANLAAAAAARLTGLDESQRDAILFGIIELWPKLARRIGRLPLDKISLVPAARMGRRGRRRFLVPLAVSVIVATFAAFLIPRLGSLLFENEVNRLENLIGSAVWATLLGLIGMISSLPLLFLYTSNALLPLSPLARLRINLWPVVGSSIIITLFLFIVGASQSQSAILTGAAALTLFLSTVCGCVIVIGTPLLSTYWRRMRRFRGLINGLSAAAVPLLVAGLLLVVLQPGSPGMAALVWAHIFVAAVGMGVAAWFAEHRRSTSLLDRDPLPIQRGYGVASITAVALILLFCIVPLVTLAITMVKPIKLDASSAEHQLTDGVVYQVPAGNKYHAFEVTQLHSFTLNHTVSLSSPKLKESGTFSQLWLTQTCSHNSELYSDADLTVRLCRDEVDVIEPNEFICYNCAGRSGTLMDFVESFSPLPRNHGVTVKVAQLRTGPALENGDQVRFGEMRNISLARQTCISGNFRLWKEGGLSDIGSLPDTTSDIDDMMVFENAENAADAMDSATASDTPDTPDCAGMVVEPGQYNICFVQLPTAQADCGDIIGASPTVSRPGRTTFRAVAL